MADALIGHSGFVGTTLLRQRVFDACYRSTTIGEIDGRRFGLVVCAGAPAQKWIANRDPQADRSRIDDLIGHLRTITCDRFVLISTVDVFKDSAGVDEDSAIDVDGLNAYGLHRYHLEKFVAEKFSNPLIVRLPGLVGPGLRKNAVYDLLNDNNVGSIDGRAQFQFYPTVRLWHDLRLAIDAEEWLVHLTAEPVSMAEVAETGFGMRLGPHGAGAPARYDFRSRHAEAYGGRGPYQYSRRDSLLAIMAYAQSEPRSIPKN